MKYFDLFVDKASRILYYLSMSKDTPLTKTDLQDILKDVKVTEGSLTMQGVPSFNRPVPFSFVKTNQCFYIFLFEPHNEKSLTNALDQVLSLLLKTLNNQEIISLNQIQETDRSQMDKSLRVFQEDSTGRIDEVFFNLGVSGGLKISLKEKSKSRVLKINKQEKSSQVNAVAVSELRWRPSSKDLFKTMKLFNLKN